MKKLCILFIILSCSNFVHNRTHKNTFHLRGGKAEGAQWHDHLIFKRISWYAEMTLLYDLLYTEIGTESPFFRWLSENEQKDLKQCPKSFVVISYQLDSDRLSHSQFENFTEQSSFQKIILTDFYNTIKMHPDFRRHFLHLYEVYALCAKNPSINSIYVNFPNFDPINMQ